MIRVQVSETEYRWLMPHRIIAVKSFEWSGKNMHGEPIPWHPDFGRSAIFTSGMYQNSCHETPPNSTIVYQGTAENICDSINVKESPEQLSFMVTEAMRPIQLERMP